MSIQPNELTPAEEILAWAIRTYGAKAAVSSSFGAQSSVILHMLSKIDPSVPVLFLDTGFLFKETHQYKNQLKDLLHLNIKEFVAPPEHVANVKKKLADKTYTMGECC